METFGKYEIVDRIGEGGFGQVFRGWDPQLKRPVAIKTVSLSISLARERFMREAEIAAGLRHPCIVSVYDFGEQDGVPYLVQELLSGEDLAHKIVRGDPLDYATRIRWLIDAAEGLAFAHARGIVHRDIKPSNIRVLDDGSIRIMDFGIAKLIDTQQQLTGTSLSVGTSGYISPEQLEGKDIDQRADIFSFGAMAYELITYQKPFIAETVQATLYKILTEEPPRIESLVSDCPDRLVRFVDTCLRKRREERYPDLNVALADLRGALKEVEQAGHAGGGAVAAPAGGSVAAETAATAVVGKASDGSAGAGSQPDLTVPFRPDDTGGVSQSSEEASPSGLRTQKLVIVGGVLAVLVLVGWASASLLGGAFRRGNRTPGDDGFGSGDGTRPDSMIVASTDSTAPDAMAGDTMRLTDAGTATQTGAGMTGDGRGSSAGAGATDSAGAGGAAGRKTEPDPPTSGTGAGGQKTAAGSGNSSRGSTGAGRIASGTDSIRAGAGATGDPAKTSSASGAGAGAAATDAGAAGGSGKPAVVVDAKRVLLLVRSQRERAIGVVETAVFGELSNQGRPYVDPETVDRIRASETAAGALASGGSPTAAVGREYGAGTVVIADLTANASPGVGGFVTGSAVILARYYDTASGRLLFSERYQVGAGGVPGRPGVNELDAITQAVESVSRQMAKAILQKTGGAS
jgi:Protein kinase domain